MTEESLKYDFVLLERIANALIINSSFIENLGLLHGKMGIAIFFAFMGRETRNRFYEIISGILIDEIFEEITITTSPDFEDGLAGIGWGIEYMVELGFIQADTDEVLECIDRRIEQILPYDIDNIGLLTGYCGYGLYLIKRIKSKNVNRTEEKNLKLNQLLKRVLAGIDTIIKSSGIDFDEPDKFDLYWDIPVLFLFVNEISSIDRSEEWSSIQKKIVLNITNNEYFSFENRFVIELLSLLDRFDKLDSDLLKLLEQLYPPSQTYVNDGMFRILLLYVLFNKKAFKDAGILDLINRYIESVKKDTLFWFSNWRTSKDLGFMEGICGTGMGLLLEKKYKDISTPANRGITQPLFIHPLKDDKRINIVFIPYGFSGAGTYSYELISYLEFNPEIELYVLEISKEIEEYSVEKTDRYIQINVPILDRTAEIQDRMLRNYFRRVVELLKNDVAIPNRTIFHFNHNLDFNNFIPLLKQEFEGYALLTYHFLLERATSIVLKEETSLLDNEVAPATDWRDQTLGNPRIFDFIICVSNFSRKVLTEFYKIPDEKTTVIWNGTSSWSHRNVSFNEKSDIKRYFGLNPDKRVILYSGRLEQRKGIEEFLEVAGELCKNFTDIHFVLAGGGEFQDYLIKCKHFLGNVSFTGNLGKEDLQRLYHIAELGVVPSRWEIFGYVPVEMMFSGLPVVATNVPGMNEIFEQFESEEFLVDVELNSLQDNIRVNKSELYSKICFLLDNPIAAERCAKAGMRCAQNFFSRHTMGSNTTTYYRKILKQ